MAVETRNLNSNRDGDGGEYWMELDIDVQANGRETLLVCRIINHRTSNPVNYWLKSPSGALQVDSKAGDPSFPPVPAGQTLTLPAGGGQFNVRIDNRTDWTTALY